MYCSRCWLLRHTAHWSLPSRNHLTDRAQTPFCSLRQLFISCVKFFARSEFGFGLKHGTHFAYGYGRVYCIVYTCRGRGLIKTIYFQTHEKSYFGETFFFQSDCNTSHTSVCGKAKKRKKTQTPKNRLTNHTYIAARAGFFWRMRTKMMAYNRNAILNTHNQFHTSCL